MPWSIFTQGGGAGAAVTWAQQLLAKIGAPATPGNLQFVYDWEVSEGGGGKFNPLNQGPVPKHPELTSTGSQYGGGAADFVSWDAGLTGASDYLHMPYYAGVLSGLLGNNPASAKAALIASPWASGHYHGGKGFSSAALPGAGPLAGDGGSSSPSGGGGSGSGTPSATLIGNPLNPADWLGMITNVLAGPALRLAIGVLGAILLIVALHALAGSLEEDTAPAAAQAAAKGEKAAPKSKPLLAGTEALPVEA